MSDVFGPAAMAVSQTVGSFSTFLPRLSEVRKAAPNDPDMAGDVRMGEVAAVAITLGVGAITSSLSKSPIPIYSALFVAIMLVVIYECALRGHRLFEPGKVSNA